MPSRCRSASPGSTTSAGGPAGAGISITSGNDTKDLGDAGLAIKDREVSNSYAWLYPSCEELMSDLKTLVATVGTKYDRAYISLVGTAYGQRQGQGLLPCKEFVGSHNSKDPDLGTLTLKEIYDAVAPLSKSAPVAFLDLNHKGTQLPLGSGLTVDGPSAQHWPGPAFSAAGNLEKTPSGFFGMLASVIDEHPEPITAKVLFEGLVNYGIALDRAFTIDFNREDPNMVIFPGKSVEAVLAPDPVVTAITPPPDPNTGYDEVDMTRGRIWRQAWPYCYAGGIGFGIGSLAMIPGAKGDDLQRQVDNEKITADDPRFTKLYNEQDLNIKRVYGFAGASALMMLIGTVDLLHNPAPKEHQMKLMASVNNNSVYAATSIPW